ncbi:MAG: TonB-dependent receptor, partial [Muribaculaceae bacterium]|nr:TonB-dependent receptor [Muribaculaceae bacterium]
YQPANPDLKPEYMLNYELSYTQYLLNNRIMLGAAIFYIDGKNMIQTVRVDGRPRNENTGKFHNKGFEIEAAYNVLSNLQASVSWSYLHTDSENLYSPKNKLNAEVTYSPGDFSFTLEEMSVWGMKYGNPDGSSMTYSLLNLRAAYTYGRQIPVTLFVKVDNMTDRHYEIIYGCPMPGTTLMGGVEFKF